MGRRPPPRVTGSDSTTPGRGTAPQPTADWQLLVADLSGLPALARIIEELPGGAPVTAIVEVADEADLDYLPHHPDVTVLPSIGTGNGHAPSQTRRAGAASSRCPTAGATAGSPARPPNPALSASICAGTAGRSISTTSPATGASTPKSGMPRFAVVEDEVLAVYERALAEGKGDKVASEEFDEALEQAGL